MNEYRKALEEQIVYWLFGASVHCRYSDECTPDFSCCGSKLLPFEARLRFVKAERQGDRKTVDAMLMMCLGGMVAEEFPNEPIRVVGDDLSTIQ